MMKQNAARAPGGFCVIQSMRTETDAGVNPSPASQVQLLQLFNAQQQFYTPFLHQLLVVQKNFFKTHTHACTLYVVRMQQNAKQSSHTTNDQSTVAVIARNIWGEGAAPWRALYREPITGVWGIASSGVQGQSLGQGVEGET